MYEDTANTNTRHRMTAVSLQGRCLVHVTNEIMRFGNPGNQMQDVVERRHNNIDTVVAVDGDFANRALGHEQSSKLSQQSTLTVLFWIPGGPDRKSSPNCNACVLHNSK